MADVANSNTLFPQIVVPFMDNATTNSFQWYMVLYGIWQRTGGGENINLSNIAASVASVQVTANNADSNAELALTEVATTNTKLATTTTTANQALVLAQAANAAQINFLARANNLSDLTNVAMARTNLGVTQFVVLENFDILPSLLTRYIPLLAPYSIPINFTGSNMWSGFYATNDATFTIGFIRNNISNVIGTMTLIHAGNFTDFIGNAAILQTGDILYITCPLVQDATLAQVGIALNLILT